MPDALVRTAITELYRNACEYELGPTARSLQKLLRYAYWWERLPTEMVTAPMVADARAFLRLYFQDEQQGSKDAAAARLIYAAISTAASSNLCGAMHTDAHNYLAKIRKVCEKKEWLGITPAVVVKLPIKIRPSLKVIEGSRGMGAEADPDAPFNFDSFKALPWGKALELD